MGKKVVLFHFILFYLALVYMKGSPGKGWPVGPLLYVIPLISYFFPMLLSLGLYCEHFLASL